MGGDFSDIVLLALQQVFTDYGEQITQQLRAALASGDKLASGSLYNSIDFDVEVDGETLSLRLLANDYLQWVDSGRRPDRQQPPMQAILKWIQDRGIRPNQKVRKNALGRFSRGFKLSPKRNKLGQFAPGGVLAQQTRLAWAIAKSIQQNGFPGLHLLDDMEEQLSQRMSDAISDLTGEAIDATITQSMLAVQTSMIKTTVQ
jgi:hypothetical protein